MRSILCCLLIAGSSVAAHAEPPQPVQPPWHLVDLYWTPGATVTCEWFSVDLTIEGDVPADLPLYLSPLGGGEGCTFNGVQCYGGLQTRPDGGNRGDRHVQALGEPGFIFSRWGERSFDALRIAERGACQSSGHEGDFVSVRVRHPWKAGTYRYILRGLDREVLDGVTHRWLGAFVYDVGADRETYVGAIRIPGDRLVLGGTLTSFAEIYGRATTTDRVPRLTITYGNHQADGRPIPMRKAVAYHGRKFPLHARAEAVGRTAAKVTLSPEPFTGSRHYLLWDEGAGK